MPIWYRCPCGLKIVICLSKFPCDIKKVVRFRFVTFSIFYHVTNVVVVTVIMMLIFIVQNYVLQCCGYFACCRSELGKEEKYK